eukprot:8802791-Prorocentrum_lima.AAC.1
MTSSLVGSEMCIRDRGADRRRSRNSREQQVGIRKEQGTTPPIAQPLGAVSYTHLTLPTICSV